MVMNVFLLGVIDSRDLGPVSVVVPRVRVNVEGSTCSLVQLLSLVEADLVSVAFDLQAVSVWDHAHALDGAINEFGCVWGRPGRYGPNVVFQL